MLGINNFVIVTVVNALAGGKKPTNFFDRASTILNAALNSIQATTGNQHSRTNIQKQAYPPEIVKTIRSAFGITGTNFNTYTPYINGKRVGLDGFLLSGTEILLIKNDLNPREAILVASEHQLIPMKTNRIIPSRLATVLPPVPRPLNVQFESLGEGQEPGPIFGPGNAGQLGGLADFGGLGIVGPDGIFGQGATGATGATGPPGPLGPAGSDGDQGPQGAAGPAGSQGPQGATGLQGATGPEGSSGLAEYSFPVRFHPLFMVAGFTNSSIVHWTGWSAVDTRHDDNTFTQQFPTWGRETDSGTGKRLTFIAQGVSIEENGQHEMNLYRGVPSAFSSFGSGGITVRHKITFSGGSSNPAEFTTINLEVYDPENAGDVVVASASRQVFADGPDTAYADLIISASSLNAAGFVGGDLLRLRMFSTSGGFVDNGALINYSRLHTDFA